MGGVGLRSDSLLFCFNFDADGPDKTQQLSVLQPLRSAVCFCHAPEIFDSADAGVLSFPSNVSDLLAQSGLTSEGPRGFNKHSSKMGVAGLSW
jgi:hypothetical protein